MPVYFIQATSGNGLIKIGYAADPRKRLQDVQRMCPISVTIIGVIKNTSQSEEKKIQEHFSHQRKYGEWFEPSQELIKFIKDNSYSKLNGISVIRRYCKGIKKDGNPCTLAPARDSDYCRHHRKI